MVTKQQNDWARSYFWSRFNNGNCYPGGSIHGNYSQLFAVDLWAGVFEEFPGVEKNDFYRLMDERVQRIENLVARLWKHNRKDMESCVKGYPYRSSTEINEESVKLLMWGSLGSFTNFGLPFDSIEKSIRLFFKVVPKWLAAPKVKVGSFVIEHCIFPHAESPLGIYVLNQKGKLVLTFGGALLYDSNGTASIRVNNMQGVRARGTNLEKREHNAQYHQLDKLLKLPWRDYFLNDVLKTANHLEIPLHGELPHRYSYLGMPTTNDKEYDRQRRNIMRTYLNAGMKQKGPIFVHSPKK